MICSIDDCDRPVLARKMCSSHYHRWDRYGDPCFSPRNNVVGWLRKFVDETPDTDECVLWPFAKDKNGYGLVDKRLYGTGLAHRAILVAKTGGPADPKMYAAHSPVICHNPSCVNPKHLRWATSTENNADRLLDDTHHRGERSPHATLTEPEVLAIYAASGSQIAIGAKYGVGRQTISSIKRGRSWAWLTGHNQENAA